MAENSKLEFRDPDEHDEEAYLVKSTAQRDLERRLDEDYKPESDVSGNLIVNPNPFGDEAYAGTDPIYQNYANDQHKPLESEEGGFHDAEEAVKELHDTDEVDDSQLAEDPGLGGVAVKADNTGGAGPTRYLVPGQEGYDRDKAEEQNAPPMRVDDATADDDDDDSGVTEIPNPGLNMGGSTQPPPADEREPGDGSTVK